jgi:leucine-rich PPR motif-containing protein, mitochondrial
LDIVEQLAIGGHGDKCEHLFHNIQKGIGYNQDVCNLILKLLNKGHIETAKAVMKTMPKNSNVDDTIFKGAFFVKHLVKVVNDSDLIIKVCAEVKEAGLVPNSFYIATEMALQYGHAEVAQKLFKVIEEEGIEIRQHYYWPLLIQKGKEGDEEGLLQILRTMSGKGLLPSSETLRDYVIPFMLKKDSPDNIILKLHVANIPAIHSARNVMIELLHLGKMKEAANIALQYRLRGQYSLLARPLLNAFGKTKDIDSFVSILHVISSKATLNKLEEDSNEDAQGDDIGDSNEVGRLVKTAIKNLPNPGIVENLLVALQTKGIRISSESAEVIQQHLDKNMTTKMSELLTQLTSADLEPAAIDNPRRDYAPRNAAQLEKLLEQVKEKDGNNIPRIQKQLLSAYIKENNIQKMPSYLEQLKASNFELSAATLAQLYEFYCNNNDIEGARQCHAEIAAKYPDFALNRYKLILLADALINVDKFDEAIQYLKDNSSKDDFEDQGFGYNSKCWQILNNIAEKKDEAKVSISQILVPNYTIKMIYFRYFFLSFRREAQWLRG